MKLALLGDHRGHPSHLELDALRPALPIATEWVPTDSGSDVTAFDGVWLVPGGPYADDAAVLRALTAVREQGIPFLGTCSGMQYAVMEYVASVLGERATHAESDGESEDNVVTALACSLYGEERLVTPVPRTRFASWVAEPFVGMHFCNFAPTAATVERLVACGVVVGATAPDAGSEVLEFPDHQFYVSSLFQPHIGALAGAPVHPLVTAFMDAVEASRPCVRSSRAVRRSVPRSTVPSIPGLDGRWSSRTQLAWRILGVDRDADLDEVPPRSRLRVFVAARHRFAEEVVAAAATRGVRQVVVLGAGLDTFAYRQPDDPLHEGLRVFEVDFPATGVWKRERLDEAGIQAPDSVTYVGVDFERDDLMGRLLESGSTRRRPRSSCGSAWCRT